MEEKVAKEEKQAQAPADYPVRFSRFNGQSICPVKGCDWRGVTAQEQEHLVVEHPEVLEK